MSTVQITHINLLERRAASLSVASMLGAVLVLTALGLFVHGKKEVSAAWAISEKRDALAKQVKDVQARMAAITDEQTRNARSVELRKQIDVLQPRAQAAQALISAVSAAEGGRADDFRRSLVAVTGVTESGLWLTNLNLINAGKKLDLQGQALSAAAVLRFAQRANEALDPMSLRMDSLEMQPVGGPAAQGAAPVSAAGVSFRLN